MHRPTAAALLATAALLLLDGAAAAATEVTGTWTLEVEWPQETLEVTLLVSSPDEGALDVVWQGPRGRLTAKSPAFENDLLTFVLVVENQEGQEFELAFRGRVSDDRMDGELEGPRGTLATVSGRRES